MALNLITTTAGRAAILAGVAGGTLIQVDDVQVSQVHQSVSISTTALASVHKTLTDVVGSVRPAGSGHALHVVIRDDSTDSYTIRALSLRLSDTTALMVYSQTDPIAVKASGSSLHLAIDLTIDADTAATITFGDTDYALPAASTDNAGIAELATLAEIATGTDPLRVVSAKSLADWAKGGLGGIAYDTPFVIGSWVTDSDWSHSIPSLSDTNYYISADLVNAVAHVDIPVPKGMTINSLVMEAGLFEVNPGANSQLSLRAVLLSPSGNAAAFTTAVVADSATDGALFVKTIALTPIVVANSGSSLRVAIRTDTTGTFELARVYRIHARGTLARIPGL